MITNVEGVFSGSFEVDYDMELFMLEGVEARELTENFLIGINAEGSGERVIFAGSNEINTSGVLFELLFSVKTDFDGESTIKINPIRLNVDNIHDAEDSAVVSKIVTDLDSHVLLPGEFALEQNYPNPFNPVTVIEYALPVQSKVKLIIYDLRGQEVVHLIDSAMPAGNHQVSFDASSLASGVYLYRLRAGDFTQMRKMVLLK